MPCKNHRPPPGTTALAGNNFLFCPAAFRGTAGCRKISQGLHLSLHATSRNTGKICCGLRTGYRIAADSNWQIGRQYNRSWCFPRGYCAKNIGRADRPNFKAGRKNLASAIDAWANTTADDINPPKTAALRNYQTRMWYDFTRVNCSKPRRLDVTPLPLCLTPLQAKAGSW